MKRNLSLVSYGSSDEDSKDLPKHSVASSLSRRKLPKVSPSLTVSVPKSDPALHQGRVRTTPHVDGQFAAFVYIPVSLTSNVKLRKLLQQSVRLAKESVPALICEDKCLNSELHISLTRPIYLRDHQREDLKRAVKAAAYAHDPFTASFSTFAVFDNDECTRTFLSVEVGAGHAEMKRLSESLEPTLALLHQKGFYSEPRFHASIAWALLAPKSGSRGELESSAQGPELKAASTCAFASTTGAPLIETPAEHTAISSFPASMLPEVDSHFACTLSKSKVGVFEVEDLCVKIGKEVFSWGLGKGKR